MSVLATTRKRLPAARRRGRALEVAAEVSANKGNRRASVVDIVEGAGIGRGNFYLYFNSKKEVSPELTEGHFSDFPQILSENHKGLEEAARNGAHFIPVWRDNMFRILRYHLADPGPASVVCWDAMGSDEDFPVRARELLDMTRNCCSRGSTCSGVTD